MIGMMSGKEIQKIIRNCSKYKLHISCAWISVKLIAAQPRIARPKQNFLTLKLLASEAGQGDTLYVYNVYRCCWYMINRYPGSSRQSIS